MLSRKSTKVWVPKLMKHTDKTLMRINIYMQVAQMISANSMQFRVTLLNSTMKKWEKYVTGFLG